MREATVTVLDFSFAAHARGFDQHISTSIPGLEDLRTKCVGLSRRYVQNGSIVVDIGCSTGALLRSFRNENQPARPSVNYVGIDTEPSFYEQWQKGCTDDVRFEVCDARSFDGFENMSLACSHFTMQFIPERDRLSLLRQVHNGLNEGGALVIAEKVLAESAEFQDILTFSYYDFKRQSYSAEEILDKERSLRGHMILWKESQWKDTLCEAGFQAETIQRFWQNYLFVAMIAIKRAPSPLKSVVPMRQCTV
jgi:tRNA (cmo5U34)-methyltransferase